MKDSETHSIELESSKLEFLETMMKAYELPDLGKAVRCLINYAREHPQKHDEIFGDIRCLDC